MYHEPAMAKHLNVINFIAELFAIPWVLWDRLILGDSSYPLFIRIAILKQLKATLMESGFNECILLFSDLPDVVMETCVNDSQEMYEKMAKSVCYRKHLLRTDEPEIFDINSVELSDIQREISSRISANNLVYLLKNKPNGVIVFNLRSQNDFKRCNIAGSINLPNTNLILGDRRLESLNVEREFLGDKVIVVISVSHDNSCLFA